MVTRRQLRGRLGEWLVARARIDGPYSPWWQLPFCLVLGHHHHVGVCYCGHVQRWRQELDEEDAAPGPDPAPERAEAPRPTPVRGSNGGQRAVAGKAGASGCGP